MRMYQPIWEKLKAPILANPRLDKSPELKIEYPPQLQNRLIKAIIKEKDLDDWQHKRFFRLISTKQGNIVTFQLEKYRKEKLLRAYISKNL
jgi:hypothetical protein